MAQHNTDTEHNHAHEHESHSKRIWTVFIILSVVTLVEVILGIIKPDVLMHTYFISLKLINWIFILLTVYKAYLITWAFMHMESETAGLRRAVVWTAIFLISYLIFVLLVEGDYIYEVLNRGHVAWDF